MRLIILLASLLITLANCSNKPLFYKGYVYHNGKPQAQVVVRRMHSNQDESTRTDSTGFFKLKKEPNSIHSLIFEKEGFAIDTIPTVWTQHGEKINYRFINDEKDTLFIKKR